MALLSGIFISGQYPRTISKSSIVDCTDWVASTSSTSVASTSVASMTPPESPGINTYYSPFFIPTVYAVTFHA